MLTTRQVPTLSLSDYQSGNTTNPSNIELERKDLFIADFFESIAEYGFVVIKNHGITPQQIEQAYQLSKKLFDLPYDIKTKYAGIDGQRGYIAFGKETAKGHKFPDLKEYWHIGPEIDAKSKYIGAYPKNYWPAEIPEFQEFFTEFYACLNKVAVDLLGALSSALSLPENYFEDMVRDGNSVQRLIYYPEMSSLEKQKNNSYSEKSVRAAAHVDINLITLLIGATESGLELLDKDGSWLPINNQEGEIVVDTGDMMARLTNNTLPATMHRVVNPEDVNRARYSIPYFVHPRNEISLASLPQFGKPKFTPINAGDFLQERLNENGFGKK